MGRRQAEEVAYSEALNKQIRIQPRAHKDKVACSVDRRLPTKTTNNPHKIPVLVSLASSQTIKLKTSHNQAYSVAHRQLPGKVLHKAEVAYSDPKAIMPRAHFLVSPCKNVSKTQMNLNPNTSIIVSQPNPSLVKQLEPPPNKLINSNSNPRINSKCQLEVSYKIIFLPHIIHLTQLLKISITVALSSSHKINQVSLHHQLASHL